MGVGVAVWVSEPSWPMFAAAVPPFTQLSNHSFTPCLFQALSRATGAQDSLPSRGAQAGGGGRRRSGQVGLDRAGKVRPSSRGGCAGKEAY